MSFLCRTVRFASSVTNKWRISLPRPQKQNINNSVSRRQQQHHSLLVIPTTTTTTATPCRHLQTFVTSNAYASNGASVTQKTYTGCKCLGCRQVHTEGDKQFLEFLKNEIKAEKEDTSSEELPAVSGFKVQAVGADVTLIKELRDEKITVELNINGSVGSMEEDLEEEDDIQREDNSSEGDRLSPPGMICQPTFRVTIQKKEHKNKLCLMCEFISQSKMPVVDGETGENDDQDAFEISELAVVDGDLDDKSYSVAAELLDGNMYEMLMIMLEERGINHKSFADELIDLCTEYEHKKFIGLLENLHNFVKA